MKHEDREKLITQPTQGTNHRVLRSSANLNMAHGAKTIAACLTGLLVCLLLVGLVSSTLVRHVIQVVPVAVALLALSGGLRAAAYFALPIFSIWALLMLLIWLYLAGVQTFFSGSFSPTEIALTVLIGGFAIVGVVACIRTRGVSMIHRIAAGAVGTAVQIAAMWVSFLPVFANR